MPEYLEKLKCIATSLGIGSFRRHVLLCTGPDCCSAEDGRQAWNCLKQALRERALDAGPKACYRTKVGCLRICCQGPTMLVYPDGTWYHGMSAERIPIFVQQHLIENRPVDEWVFAKYPLPGK